MTCQDTSWQDSSTRQIYPRTAWEENFKQFTWWEQLDKMSSNNVSFVQTVKMGRMFSEKIRKSRGLQIPNMKNPLESEQILNTFFEFAEMAATLKR
jgi:hypothetical protein